VNPHYIEDVPVIRYDSTGRSVLMNDWHQDPEFVSAVRCFPWVLEGGQDQRTYR
jgi:hypothetical protein